MSKLPDVHRAEYQRLKQEIARLEQQKQSSSSRPGSGTASPDPNNAAGLPKSLQITVKSGGKSATSSPDRSVTRDVLKSNKKKQGNADGSLVAAAVQDNNEKGASKVSPEEVLLREQKQKQTLEMLLKKEKVRQKEVKNCQEKMTKHRLVISCLVL